MTPAQKRQLVNLRRFQYKVRPHVVRALIGMGLVEDSTDALRTGNRDPFSYPLTEKGKALAAELLRAVGE